MNGFDYKIRILSNGDIKQIKNCLIIARKTRINENIFIIPTIDYINKIINGYGKSAGVFIADKLIGFASIVFPKKGKHNLGHLLNYNESKLLSVVQLEHIFVLPDYRGNGFAKYLIKYLLNDIDKRFSFLLSTISPQNINSLSVAFKIKQKIIKLVNVYGVSRYLMFANLNESSKGEELGRYFIHYQHIDKINNLLVQGYKGVSFGNTKDTILFLI